MARRWIATAPGGPEVLTLEDHDVSPPGPGEVTIEVWARGGEPGRPQARRAGPTRGLPESRAYRDRARTDVLRMAAEGLLEVPLARTYPLQDALETIELLRGGHPGGKLALLP